MSCEGPGYAGEAGEFYPHRELKLGSLTRFVSESVMTGFFPGVAVLLVLTQLDKLTGYKGGVGGNALIKFWH